MNPLAVSLEMNYAPADDAEFREIVTALAALLHERHHWLQHVGTSVGIFNGLLLELQTGLIAGWFGAESLTEEDVPLLRGRFAEDSRLELWERVEAFRRLFFGCRVGDFNALVEDGRGPVFRVLAELLKPIVLEFCTADPPSPLLGVWEDLEDISEAPHALTRRGWLVGARHLMECGARLSEQFKFAADLGKTGEAFSPAPLFTGVYGVVHEIFYEQVGRPTVTSEIVLATLCDLALNLPCPPVFPSAGAYVDRSWSPGALFAMLLTRIEGFDPGRRVDPRDPDAVRGIVERVIEHVGIGDYRRLASGAMASLIGHLRPDEVAEQIYELPDDGWPRPVGNGGRFRYMLSVSAEAFRIRESVPELFVLPFAHYARDRAEFRSFFDRAQPPLLSYGAKGIAPARGRRGWLEHFMGGAVQYEILRGMVMFTASELATRLVPFVQSVGGQEHGLAVVTWAIRNTLRDGPLADALVRHLSAAVAVAGPVSPPGAR